MERVTRRLEPFNPTCRWHVGRRERAPALPYSVSAGHRGNEPRHPPHVRPKESTPYFASRCLFQKKNSSLKLGLDILKIIVIISHIRCGCSSSGRAPPCQGGGSEFEPRHPLHKKEPGAFAPGSFLWNWWATGSNHSIQHACGMLGAGKGPRRYLTRCPADTEAASLVTRSAAVRRSPISYTFGSKYGI